jgi:hypothetical protein
MAWIDDTIKLVKDYDAVRPRSTQVAVGWSEVGGCRAYLGFRLDGTWPSDETDNWGAIRGTAIHTLMETVLGIQPGMTTEVVTSYRGIPGHADLIVDPTSVTDHKTSSLANSKRWRDNPSLMRQKRIQGHGYAAGLVEAGILPEDCTVRLLIIPVDGKFEDWWAYEEPFDRALADEGADRLEDVRHRLEVGDHLPKDMPYAWCSDWCEFFSLCRTQDDPEAVEVITDLDLVSAIATYGEAVQAEGAARKTKDGLAPVIRGLRGTTEDGGWRISLGKRGEDKDVIDEDTIRGDYFSRGERIPMTTAPGNKPSLRVTKITAKAAAKAKAEAA